MTPDPFALAPAAAPPASSRWWWIGGLVLTGATLGAGVWYSRGNGAVGNGAGGEPKPPGGTTSPPPPPPPEPKPPELEGWPFQVAVGSTQIELAGQRRFRFFRVMPPNPIGPVVWVLHGKDTDPRKLAPWIPTSLAEVVFVQAPEGWLTTGGAAAAAVELLFDASHNRLPGPFVNSKKVRPWVVVGYDVGADVALQLAAPATTAAPPDAAVVAAPLEPEKFSGADGEKRWLAFLIGDKDPMLGAVQAAAESSGKPAGAGGGGYNTAVRVVAGAGHELPPLGPQLRDLLLDVFSMFPYPS